MGKPANTVRLSEDNHGQYFTNVVDGKMIRRIDLAATISAREWLEAYAHEMGHLMDDLAGKFVELYSGRIPVRMMDHTGLEDELGFLYHVMKHPDRAQGQAAVDARIRGERSSRRLTTPADIGGAETYPENMWPFEWWAEAGRAYLQNPDLIKAVAPNVAAHIRNAWNESPKRRMMLHLNSITPPGLLFAGGAAVASSGIDREPTDF